MNNRLKKNTKIKIISLLSAIVLWMYVMAIVDPDDTKLFENVPVTVTNAEELEGEDLVVYPETDLVADIYITGKLSYLQKINQDDIYIYGSINKPIEGNNYLYLKVNITKQVSYEFKSDFIVVRLEKLVHEEKEIITDIEGKYKNDVDTITLQQSTVRVSGPRVLVDEVDTIKATINVDSDSESKFTQSIKLIPVNTSGKEVKGVTLDSKNINAEVTLLEEKEVPINIQIEGNTTDDTVYEVDPKVVLIKGKKELLDNISYINTKKIDLSNLSISKKVELIIPDGVTSNETSVTVKVKENENESFIQRLIYGADEIELRNNYNDTKMSELNIPNSINVEVQVDKSDIKVNKSDIKLYIDLSEVSDQSIYKIKYDSELDLQNINIIPNTVSK